MLYDKKKIKRVSNDSRNTYAYIEKKTTNKKKQFIKLHYIENVNHATTTTTRKNKHKNKYIKNGYLNVNCVLIEVIYILWRLCSYYIHTLRESHERNKYRFIYRRWAARSPLQIHTDGKSPHTKIFYLFIDVEIYINSDSTNRVPQQPTINE